MVVRLVIVRAFALVVDMDLVRPEVRREHDFPNRQRCETLRQVGADIPFVFESARVVSTGLIFAVQAGFQFDGAFGRRVQRLAEVDGCRGDVLVEADEVA